MKGKWDVGSRMFAWALVGLLTLGSGTTLVADPSAALTVASDPVGAAVYVDGQLLGQTPLALARVAAGDHRVRVVKEGYLENSRVVTMRAGQADAVNVRLTRSSSTARMQVDDRGQPREEKGGGSGKKIALIALGAVVVGGGVYLLLPKNDPPVAGTIGVSPATALMGATEVTFTSQGSSDPDGDPLTYAWNFGDGQTGSGSTVKHTYAQAGTFSVTLKIADKKVSVDAPAASVTVKSMTGSWSGSVYSASLSLTQAGTSLSGNYSDSDDYVGSLTSGSVSAPREVRFAVRATWWIYTWTPTFACTLDDSLNTCSGTCTGCTSTSASPFTWTRR
jgi:hypothetical protein